MTDHLYLLPIGGTAMATLAGLLQAAGHRVEGVDTKLYPPMSTLLEELGIDVREGFDPSLIPSGIDRVIIGNAVPRSNPEVDAIIESRLPYLSQAEAVAHYFLAEGREAMVVAGTHGKTTTSSLLTWVMEAAGTDPTAFVGGLLQWSRRSFRLGNGRWMVIEGDEYNSAFFDRGPKFLHYRPRIFLLGPVEFDHADLYRDLDAVLTAFRAGVAQVPSLGAVVVNATSEHALAVARTANADVVTVGESLGSTVQVAKIEVTSAGSTAELTVDGQSHRLLLPLAGRHNIHNAAMAVAGAWVAGVSVEHAVDALARFPGVARRMEVIGEASGVVVVDDFAHHPTAIAVTLEAARQHWPDRRLVVAYEPRSLSASRKNFEAAYVDALARADVILVAAPFHRKRVAPEELIDRQAMARELEQRGRVTAMPEDDDDPVAVIRAELRSGDVVIGCSSGAFGDFHRRLLKELRS